jgi:chitodextrinase
VRFGVDSTAPTTPTGLVKTGATSTSVSLAWSASTDPDDSSFIYTVRRTGGSAPTTSWTTPATTFQDTTVAPEMSYTYTVDATDAAGNTSAPSEPLTVLTQAGSAPFTLPAIADAKVDSTSSVTAATSYPTGPLRLDASPVIRSFLKFDASAVTGTVVSAKLQVWANSAQSVGYDVYGVTDTSWTEATVNYNAQPAGIAATKTSSSGPVQSGMWTSVDVTPLVTGGGLKSFMLSTTSSTALSLASREDAAHPPQLIITTS